MINNLRKLRCLSIVAIIFFAVLTGPALNNKVFAAPVEARVAELTEKARKEGQVSLYTSTNMEATRIMVEKFQEKHPFIKVGIYRSGKVNIFNRALVETKAKKMTNDVIWTGWDMIQPLKENGVLTKYLSPEREFYPEGFKDQDGYWTDTHLSVHTLAYNTRLVLPKDMPVQYKDLLNPKWKGKLGVNLNNYMWFQIITKIMGEREGMEFMKGLAQQNPIVRNGGTLMVLLVAAGEIPLAVSINANNIDAIKAKKAPVDWVRWKEPLYAELHPIAINALAPHPNAAKLLIDFVLSPEGQELMVKHGSTSSRRGMRSTHFSVEDITPLLPTTKETAYCIEQMRKLFLK